MQASGALALAPYVGMSPGLRGGLRTDSGSPVASETALEAMVAMDTQCSWRHCGSQFNAIPARFACNDTLLLAASGAAVDVYSVATGERIRQLTGHKNTVTSVATDGSHVITCALDGRIVVFEVESGAVVDSIDVKSPCVRMQVAATSIIVATNPGGGKGAVMKIDRQSKAVTSIMKTKKPVSGLAVAPDGATIACVSSQKLMVRLASGTVVSHRHSNELLSVCFHPEDNYICTSDVVGRITLWYRYHIQGDHAKKGSPNSKKGCVTSVLHWHAHGFGALQFTDDGTYLLSGGNEKVLVQWHMRDGHKQFLPRLGGAIQGIAVSARGDMFAVTCADNTIRVISSISSRVKTVIRGVVTRRPDPVCKSHGTVKFDQSPAMQRPFELHPDPRIPGHVVIVAPNNTNVQVYDVVRGCNKLQIETDPMAVNRDGVAYIDGWGINHDGQWIAVSLRSSQSRLVNSLSFRQWDSSRHTYCLRSVVHDIPAIKGILFHPAEDLCVVLSGASFQFWGTAARDNPPRMTKTDAVRPSETWACRAVGEYRGLKADAAAFSNDGSVVAILFQGSIVTLWDTTTMELLHTVRQFPDIHTIGFCGRHLICVSATAVVSWDTVSRSMELKAPMSARVAAFSSRMFAVATDSTVHLMRPDWKVPLLSRKLKCSALAFISNDTTLVAISQRGELCSLKFSSGVDGGAAGGDEAVASAVPSGGARVPLQDLFGRPASNESDSVVPKSKPASGIVSSGLAGPSHVMPPLDTMYANAMGRLMAPKPLPAPAEHPEPRPTRQEDDRAPGPVVPRLKASEAETTIALDAIVASVKKRALVVPAAPSNKRARQAKATPTPAKPVPDTPRTRRSTRLAKEAQ